MLAKMIDKILELSVVTAFEIDGRTYTNNKIYRVLDPEPESIDVNTLTGLADYIRYFAAKDGLKTEDMMVLVETFNQVKLYSKIQGNFLQRAYYMSATAQRIQFGFERTYNLEEFIIALQANFEPTEDAKKILALVGNVSDENIVNHSDDGITQTVNVRKGISMKGVEDVPNPVTLKPYRTFREIDQPESQFIFRMESGKNSPPWCNLIPADGDRWQLEAIERIKSWLIEKLPEEVTVIA